jgi:hypothetical protein
LPVLKEAYTTKTYAIKTYVGKKCALKIKKPGKNSPGKAMIK